MSAEHAGANSDRGVADQTLSLDISQLHALPSEQQELYLLTFVNDLWRHVEAQPPEALSGQVAQIKKETIKIIGLALPSPSRVIRHTAGKLLANLFARGSRSLLFSTLNELLTLVNATKADRDLATKHAAVVALGYVYGAHCEYAVSHSGLICASLLKVLKQSQGNVGIRASVFHALGQITKGLRTSIDEAVAREIWKQARPAASGDKSSFVQRQACICLRSLVTATDSFSNSSDFDSLKTTGFKALESTNPAVRHAAAALLAQGLASGFSLDHQTEAVPIVKRPRKAKKQVDPDEGEDDSRPGSPAAGRPVYRLKLNLREILRTLSTQYVRPSTDGRSRAGIMLCYTLTLQQLPEPVVQDNYALIVDHFFYELLNSPVIALNRHRTLTTRRYVAVVVQDTVGSKLLSQTGQVNAAKHLINSVLKNYPPVIKERREPPKRVLTAALQALTSLINELGSASSAFQDQCREAVLQVLHHPNHTVQAHAVACLKSLAVSCPQQALLILDSSLAQVKKSFEAPSEGRHAWSRMLGLATTIAAVINSTKGRPLYGSVSMFSQAFGFAMDLLKVSSSAELRQSAAHIQAAWTIIGGLMSLGPHFVKRHLQQLLLLWRNALPVPLSADNAAKRGHLELSFLCHVREHALCALLAFLEFNRNLLTSDSLKRVLGMLQSTVAFMDSLPRQKDSVEIVNRLMPALQLRDLALILRRRVLQCFVVLMQVKHIDHREILVQSDVLNLAMSSFLNFAGSSTKSLEASVLSSASAFERLWDQTDNWAFGATSLVTGAGLNLEPLQLSTGLEAQIQATNEKLDTFELQLVSPIANGLEHDVSNLYRSRGTSVAENVAASTSVVDWGIVLFAISLPHQSIRVQESAFEQLLTVLLTPLQREPGKRASLQVNVLSAVISALFVSSGQTSFPAGSIAFATIEKAALEMFHRCLTDPDPPIRTMAALGLGHLCGISGSRLTNQTMKHLVETVVSNRDPNARAGCAISIGYVSSLVGGMAASAHLKSVTGVLFSLCSDGHPIVHHWALKGLTAVCDSAGLAYSGFAISTLGLLAQLYLSDNHSVEAAALGTSNLEMESPSTPLIGKCTDAVLNVLGPDLQDIGKARQLLVTLVEYYGQDEDIDLQVQSLTCFGHLGMYAPAHLPFRKYVQDLQGALRSADGNLREVAIQGLSSLMKHNATEVVRVASLSLIDDLWSTLDELPGNRDIKSIFRNWLAQSALTETSEWVQRCQNILSKTRLKAVDDVPLETAKATAGPDLVDEEVAGFAAAAAAAQGDNAEAVLTTPEFLRWQTRDFALSLLTNLIDRVSDSISPDQVTSAELALQGRVADIIRMAFSASTANVVDLRVRGLKIIDQVLRLFGRTPDPDFLEASLLEQYQAQIASALTPAFAADSSPELAAEAISVCATFVSAGIVTIVDRMGRIFKILVQGLENIAGTIALDSIGDLKHIGTNAQSMLKMSILAAWADLVLESREQPYLEPIVKPQLPSLAPLWVQALQEYAQLRFEPDISSSLGDDYDTKKPEERYAAYIRDARLMYYQQNWLDIVDAIATLVDRDSESVFEALDRKPQSRSPEINGINGTQKDISFQEEPVAFFFILYGLAFEALVVQAREYPSQALSILQALKKILTPAVCGNAIYEDIVFDETTDVLDRLALTSGYETQAVLVEVARNLSVNHVSANSEIAREEKLSDDIDQLFELTRIIVLVLSGLIPTLEDPPSAALRAISDDAVGLIRRAFEALVEVSKVFPAIITTDLTACIIHAFCSILATGICQAEVVPRLIPVFKAFIIANTVQQDKGHHAYQPGLADRPVRGCLQRLLAIMSQAQRRENEYALPCAKNTLLAMSVLLTSGGAMIEPNDDLILRAAEELLDCLQDVGLAKVAANCIRLLLSHQPKPASTEAISRMLWIGIVQFLTNEPDEGETHDPENVTPSLSRSLVIATVSLGSRSGKVAAMSLLVPCLLTVATRSASSGTGETELEALVAQQLFSLASTDGVVFRMVLNELGDHDRLLLQGYFKQAAASNTQGRMMNGEQRHLDENEKPAIQLRMDF